QVWKTLEHNCPVLAPLYTPLPKNVKLIYDGETIDLSLPSEEVAGFYAAMIK
ncbi:eukaryotic DNA topoisomerase I, DNA binding, partial [Sphaeroforma arctica JP610]